MPQRVFITIGYGSDAGPFDLFTNVDGYTTPFATNVSNAILYAGYLTNSVPDGATIIKLVSKGNCNTVGFFPITGIPTSTSTSTSTSSTSTSSTTSTTTTIPTSTSTSTSTSTTTRTSTSTSTSTTSTTTTELIEYIYNAQWCSNPLQSALFLSNDGGIVGQSFFYDGKCWLITDTSSGEPIANVPSTIYETCIACENTTTSTTTTSSGLMSP
jgi:hypothetical protein